MLPDGTPGIVSGHQDGTARLWRLADSTRLVPPLKLSIQVGHVAVHGNIIVTAAGSDIAVHQLRYGLAAPDDSSHDPGDERFACCLDGSGDRRPESLPVSRQQGSGRKVSRADFLVSG